MGMGMGPRGGRGGGGASGMASYLEEQKRRGRKTDAHTLRRVAISFKPYKIKVVLVVFAILLTTGLGLINPLLIARTFDDAITKRDLRLLIIYVIIMIVTPVVTGLIGVWQSYLNNVIGQSVMRDFRNRLYEHMQKMSLRFFTATKTGEIQSRLSNDVNGVQSVVTSTATSIVSNIAIVASTIIVMIWLNYWLTLISLCMLPLFLWITVKVGNVRRSTSKETQQSMASLTAMMQETLSVSGILLMKTFGRQEYARQVFEAENQNLTELEVRQQMVGRWFFMSINVFFSIMPAVVYLVAGWMVINHDPGMTFGTIVAFTTLQTRIFFPIAQLLSIQVDIQGALALFDRIFEYLDIPIEITDKPEALQLTSQEASGRVTFDHVSFSYKRDLPDVLRQIPSTPEDGKGPDILLNGKRSARNKYNGGQRNGANGHTNISDMTAMVVDTPVEPEENGLTLNDVSFDILPGQLAALVGPSGAGKTTMTYMVPRLYDVDSGAVEIDGHNVKDLSLASLGNLVGMVTQETYLLHASVRENLLYARADATDEEMIAATKAAAIHERIMELDEGYDTLVGERGYRLSGGEKQRIAIARVILKNPRILILDEATSALDTHSERLIQAALVPLMRGRTTLAIAHRLSTILAADVILVVDKGEIVERGTHQELLQANGLYAQLYQEQFQAVTVEEETLA
ncbi:ABC transporter ATP-binding protein [Dictyobacter arantiisoli]|uniref:Multidrug ABC transporter ATP-binding protein n=1 Tax=Dictyobacter arantiisoli TaxID=2014874 RepID=A0A5A5T598_9CHLR|nr:ABC transporter ATP-binding protein [Dictyobacter arantiisoli]GCF06467.1 multidrug ABC transporter ATP-binding protein [Dictyobacter arantiisoli]